MSMLIRPDMVKGHHICHGGKIVALFRGKSYRINGEVLAELEQATRVPSQ